MKKFIAYMMLALVLYIAIYAVVLILLRSDSADVSEFCDQLQTGTPVSEIQKAATGHRLIFAFHDKQKAGMRLLFVSLPENKDAVCQIGVENDRLAQKKFILRTF